MNYWNTDRGIRTIEHAILTDATCAKQMGAACQDGENVNDAIARVAFDIADAMMKARVKR